MAHPLFGPEVRLMLQDNDDNEMKAFCELLHPATVLRACNFVLNRNVSLGPWIHTGSQVQHLATASVGDRLSVRAHITGNYQHKGHSFVELDALVLANETRAIARVAHIAIYRPRQVAAAQSTDRCFEYRRDASSGAPSKMFPAHRTRTERSSSSRRTQRPGPNCSSAESRRFRPRQHRWD